MRDARYVYWSAGDCFMIYPGANSCLRFEKLREGIADYEKIRIIKAFAAQSSDKQVREMNTALTIHLQSFNTEKEFNEEKLKDDIKKGKEMINELSERLSVKK